MDEQTAVDPREEELADMLRRAEVARMEFLKLPDWPVWYAKWLLANGLDKLVCPVSEAT